MLMTLAPLRRVLLLIPMLTILAACEDPTERALRHYDRGLSLLESGVPEKAVLEFRNALRLDEGFVAARFELAKILERSGDLAGALANLHAVVEHDPAHAQARIRLANAMLLSNHPDKAMKHAEIAVRAAPLLPDALVARAMAAYRLGDAKIALADARAALALDAENAEAGLVLAIERYDAGDIAAAHAVLDQFLASNPNALTLHLMKLQYLINAEDQIGTGTQLRVMVEAFPANIELRRSKVAWHLRNEDPEGAEEELEAIQALLPDDLEVLRTRVDLRAKVDGAAAARSLLEEEIGKSNSPGPLEVQLAILDHQSGATTEARTRLDHLISKEQDPATVNDARLVLARLQGAESEYGAAVRTLTDLLEADSGNAEALALRAAARVRTGAFEEALLDIRAALGEDADNVNYLMLAARIQELNGSPVLAGENLAAAVIGNDYAAGPVFAYAEHLSRTGDADGVGSLLTEARRRQPGDDRIAKALAQHHLRLSNWREAARIADQLEPSDPTAAQRIRAEVALGREDRHQALTILDRMAHGPDSGTGQIAARLRGYVRAGTPEVARSLIETHLSEDPANIGLLQLRGAMHELDGEQSLAGATYRAMLEADPKSVDAYVTLAAFHDRSGDSDVAMKIARNGLEIAPDNPLLRLHVASLALRQGNPEAAIAEFERIYADQPESMLAANNLASALAEHHRGDPDRIARAEKIARRLAGSVNPAFMDTLGWTRYLSGDVKGSLQPLIEAAKGLPENPWVRYHAGMAHLGSGSRAEARSHLDAALKLAGDSEFAPRGAISQAIETIDN